MPMTISNAIKTACFAIQKDRPLFPLLHISFVQVIGMVAFVTCMPGLSAHAADANEPANRPNIILIMADDMGYECVAANGGGSYQTPRLDRLAVGGMRFEHCHSQPICTPTRVQIMTGIYNNRNYVRFGVLDKTQKTFGNLFRSAGYKTCIVGKWQLDGGLDAPQHFGFDEYCLWQLNRRPGRYSNPGLEINGKQVDYRDGEFGPDIVSDYLCDFIRRHQDEPFFAWYPMILPHFPFVPTPDSADYDRTVIGEKGLGQTKYFKGMVEYVDKIVGKVVDCVEENGLSKNTLVIFTGDNGTHPKITSLLNGTSYPGGKGSTTDNGTHVPMIAHWPGTIPAGSVTRNLVDFTDILPTLADVAGLSMDRSQWTLDGYSFRPTLLSATAVPHRDTVYCWYHRDGVREKATQHVRTQHFKLYSDGRYFDTRSDLLEQSPLATEGLQGDARSRFTLLKQPLERHIEVTHKADPVQKARREELQRTPVRKK
ncbi:MAG: sulfatase-like hydrolase/transferase [Planctomycetaceae bacterium]